MGVRSWVLCCWRTRGIVVALGLAKANTGPIASRIRMEAFSLIIIFLLHL